MAEQILAVGELVEPAESETVVSCRPLTKRDGELTGVDGHRSHIVDPQGRGTPLRVLYPIAHGIAAAAGRRLSMRWRPGRCQGAPWTPPGRWPDSQEVLRLRPVCPQQGWACWVA